MYEKIGNKWKIDIQIDFSDVDNACIDVYEKHCDILKTDFETFSDMVIRQLLINAWSNENNEDFKKWVKEICFEFYVDNLKQYYDYVYHIKSSKTIPTEEKS